MTIALACELKIERKPSLTYLSPTVTGENSFVNLTMTSIVILANVMIQPRQIQMLDGAQLGFVQSTWAHRYWSRYEGPNVADGSALIDEVGPGVYNRIVYTDTVLRGELFYAKPDEPFTNAIQVSDRGDYSAVAGLPGSVILDSAKQRGAVVKLAMGDKTVSPVVSAVKNSLSGKLNMLAECFVQQEFYAGLVVRERSGNATCLGIVHWWQSYHYDEASVSRVGSAAMLTHTPVLADTYIRVGAPTRGAPADPAFGKALVTPSPISATEAFEASTWSVQSFDGRDASDHLPTPAPFGVFK